ncbi:Metallo-dependent phosphatase-like protein [Tirmania nivea]|nr:Metallo-dependent phosphatase-like protein [Tirmania nivea]
MENYQKANALQSDRETTSCLQLFPVRGEEREPRPEADQSSQAESASSSSFFNGRIPKDKAHEKRERLRNQKDITPHSNSLHAAFYDMSTSSSLTGVEGGPHYQHHPHGGEESVKTTWSQKHRKKVRIVCISDTHNQTPARLPPGDVLIHAGDLTNSGTYKELSRAAEWLRNLKGYEYKIVVPGNHDLGLDRSWVEDFGYEIGVGLKEEECLGGGRKTWKECVELFLGEEARDRGVVYIGPAPGDYDHSGGSRERDSGSEGVAEMKEESIEAEEKVRVPGKMKELRLSNGVKFTVWGCPAIPRIMRPDLPKEKIVERSTNPTIHCTMPKRQWAFGYSAPVSLEESCWADIPASGIDILVTHTPPKYHLDSYYNSSLPTLGAIPGGSSTVQAGLERATFFGCEFLRQALWRTKPKLHVFGHVHEGRGAQVVRWDTDSKWTRWREGRVVEWIEPGGNKMSLVDLTGRGRGRSQDWKVVVDEGKGVGGEAGKVNSPPGIASDETSRHTPDGWPMGYTIPKTDTAPSFTTVTTAPALLPGRDTCLVNASYVTSSYYSRGAAHATASRAASVAGGTRNGKGCGVKTASVVNKPVVVDLELEIEAGWLEEREREERRRERRSTDEGGGG